ncbi:MAG TPA: aldo/keto reductase [Streptosporangiaceae bacterium]|nr:aldo/keto reductase [Streptosporangiaceae bacterium]
MRYVCLGRSGLRISALGLGCGGLGTRVTGAAAEHLVKSALDLGVNLFDTADVYGKGAGEEALGRALGGDRDHAVVATKVRWAVGDGPNDRGASRIHIRAAVEASLRRLGTDRIDLYQVHAPDPGTPIDETISALDGLVTSGKVLYIGLSNFAGWQLVDAHWQTVLAGRTRFVSTQAPYSLLARGAEHELLPAARHCGVGFLACLVLARGYLAGGFDDDTDPATLTARQRAYLTPVNRRRRDLIAGFAAARGRTLAEVALAAAAGRPGVTGLLVGASSAEQLTANAKVFEHGLTDEDVAELLAELDRLEVSG